MVIKFLTSWSIAKTDSTWTCLMLVEDNSCGKSAVICQILHLFFSLFTYGCCRRWCFINFFDIIDESVYCGTMHMYYVLPGWHRAYRMDHNSGTTFNQGCLDLTPGYFNVVYAGLQIFIWIWQKIFNTFCDTIVLTWWHLCGRRTIPSISKCWIT